ncbi:MAG: hypothetical protein IT204_19810 [Fimbriimonadaceae bacterium]|nr:hypothetical protein [Fimbriimonadaceae bacterium]
MKRLPWLLVGLAGALLGAAASLTAARCGAAPSGPLARGLLVAGSLLLLGPPRWPAAVGGLAGSLLLAALPGGLLAPLLARFADGAALPAPAGRLLAVLLAGSWLTAAVALDAVLRCWAARPRGWRLALAVAAIYGALAVSAAPLQTLTGDEPHYLLQTVSLWQDGDADLGNDYGQGRWRAFFPSDWLRRATGLPGPLLDPHEVGGPDGRRRPIHQLGLSLLLLPGYALGGVAGARLTGLLLAVLAAVAVVRLATTLAGEEGWDAACLVLFTSPLLTLGPTLHTEGAALGGLAWLGHLAVHPAPRRRELALGALLAGGLVWIHLKLLPLVALLALTIAWRQRRVAASGPLFGLAVGLLTQLAWFAAVYGSWALDAPQRCGGGKFPGPGSGNPLLGLPGLLVDPQDGLFAVSPAWLLLLPGWRLAWADRRARPLLLAALGHLALIASFLLWRSGFAPGGRQLLPALALTLPALQAGWQTLGDGRLRRALLTASALLLAAGAVLPRLRYPGLLPSGGVQPLWLALLPTLAPLLPTVGASGLANCLAWVYLGGLWAWLSRRRIAV